MSRSHADRVVEAGLGLTALLSGGTLLLIVWFLFEGAKPALDFGMLGHLFGDGKWQPGSVRDPQFGVMSMLIGSLLVTGLSILLAAPAGVLSAIFLSFYSPARLARGHRRLLELLAAVPSVVFGFWGLTVLVPAIDRLHPPGQSLLAAALVLSLMILPTIALTSVSALQAVPVAQLQAAAALGIGRPRLIWSVVLPAAWNGVGAGILLAAARAIGETMAVMMVCGNIAQIPASLFDPVRPVTATIALEMGYASAAHKSLLYAAGLLLVLVTGALICGMAFRRQTETSLPRSWS
ncbi:MAG: phosphate transport system permease protein [Verrucomicrobia bacterium]|nr:MAG: phosphate transport system permease protein [Verrucomicrobiota bacterium]